MATKRPSFLKRQKEMKRITRAQEKRDARRERKERKGTEPEGAADAGVESMEAGHESPDWTPVRD